MITTGPPGSTDKEVNNPLFASFYVRAEVVAFSLPYVPMYELEGRVCENIRRRIMERVCPS